MNQGTHPEDLPAEVRSYRQLLPFVFLAYPHRLRPAWVKAIDDAVRQLRESGGEGKEERK